MAIKVGFPDEQTLQAVMGRVDQNFRPFLLQQQPNTMAELKAHAQTLEGSYSQSPAVDNAMLQAMVEMRPEMNNLQTKLNSEASSTPYTPQNQDQGRDNCRRSGFPNRHWQGDRAISPYWNRGQRSPSPHWNRGGHRSPSPWKKDHGRSTSQHYQDQGKKEVRFRTEGQYGACLGCGKYHNRSTCSARNAQCHIRGKIGHIARVCRQAKVQNTQPRD